MNPMFSGIIPENPINDKALICRRKRRVSYRRKKIDAKKLRNLETEQRIRRCAYMIIHRRYSMNLVFKLAKVFVAGLILLMAADTGFSSELVIYPAQGQSNEQLEKDKYECYQWAKQQSGFDPMAPPTASTPPPQQQTSGSSVVKGAARGALLGVTVGAITNNSKSRSAGAGAAAGGLMGGMSRRDQASQQQQAQKQWEQQEVQRYTELRNSYNRAYSACLEGKGYTVK